MKNLIKRIILDFHNRPYPSYKLRHAVFPRGLEKIITIIGPRRAGKTYFLFQIMDKLEQQGVPRHHMLYLNFEDERLDFADNYDPIIEAWQELYPELDISQTYFFFDEIQEARIGKNSFAVSMIPRVGTSCSPVPMPECSPKTLPRP